MVSAKRAEAARQKARLLVDERLRLSEWLATLGEHCGAEAFYRVFGFREALRPIWDQLNTAALEEVHRAVWDLVLEIVVRHGISGVPPLASCGLCKACDHNRWVLSRSTSGRTFEECESCAARHGCEGPWVFEVSLGYPYGERWRCTKCQRTHYRSPKKGAG